MNKLSSILAGGALALAAVAGTATMASASTTNTGPITYNHTTDPHPTQTSTPDGKSGGSGGGSGPTQGTPGGNSNQNGNGSGGNVGGNNNGKGGPPKTTGCDFASIQDHGNQIGSHGLPCLPPPPVKVTVHKNPAKGCVPETVVFDFKHGTSTLTEVKGPKVYNGETAWYDGTKYTIKDVHGAHPVTFEVTTGGHTVNNTGSTIKNGKATVGCTPGAWTGKGHKGFV